MQKEEREKENKKITIPPTISHCVSTLFDFAFQFSIGFIFGLSPHSFHQRHCYNKCLHVYMLTTWSSYKQCKIYSTKFVWPIHHLNEMFIKKRKQFQQNIYYFTDEQIPQRTVTSYFFFSSVLPSLYKNQSNNSHKNQWNAMR